MITCIIDRAIGVDTPPFGDIERIIHAQTDHILVGYISLLDIALVAIDSVSNLCKNVIDMTVG